MTREGYMCFTDYEWHIEGDKDGTKIYPSLAALEADKHCVKKECGIVKVKLEIVEVVKDEEF